MRRSNFPLRLQPSLLAELRKAAGVEGVALNQLINVAVAEKSLPCGRRSISGREDAEPIGRRLCGFSNAPGGGMLL